jgi:hypothetical protein
MPDPPPGTSLPRCASASDQKFAVTTAEQVEVPASHTW